MEGWDGTTTGGVTEEMRRRCQRFGESGAKLICGAEAMAVRPAGRANANTIIIVEEKKAGLAGRGVGRQGGGERRAHSDGTDSRTATAVGDAERLVQVEVRDVGAELAGLGDAHERGEVGAVDVDLPTVGVHDLADVGDGGLEHPVRRGIGDHQARQVGRVGIGLGLQVVEIDVAAFVAPDDDDLHVGHRRARRIRAVGRRGDAADVAVRLAPALVIGPDGEQPGVLALAAGVGL